MKPQEIEMDLQSIGIYAALIMILSLPLNFYVMFTKLEATERYLQCSVYIVMNKQIFRNETLKGKHQRLFAAAAVILMPRVFEWRHLVLAEDVKAIPKKLKLWIVLPSLLTLISAVIMTLSGLTLIYKS